MKNILIVGSVFAPESVTSAMMNYDLAIALKDKHHVTVLRPFPTRPIGSDYSGYKDDFPFDCVMLDSYTHPKSQMVGRFRESIDFGKKCVKYIKEHHAEIDVVYNCSWQLFGYNIVTKACVKYNIPCMNIVQDIYPECIFTGKKLPGIVTKLACSILAPIDRYTQRHSYMIRTISDEMADYLSKTRCVARDKYLVLDNWQNDEDFTYIPNERNDGMIIFGYVGSINSHSNTDLIIRAFHEAAIPNSELRIYGGGNKKDFCVELVKELGLKNVSFGFVKKTEVPAVQASVDVLILALPKGNGGLCLPSKMTSYMLSGRPVLASVDEDSATTRYIKEGNCGMAVTPDSITELVKGMQYFETLDRQALSQLCLNSRKFAEERLTRASNLPKVIKALEDAVKM